jgi:excisionase family DNA binding protein
MIDRVLVALPNGQWLALAPDLFREALAAGGAVAEGSLHPPETPANASDEQLLDARQLGKALALPVTWLEQAAREHRIPSIQAGRWRRFRRSAVEQALAANGKTPPDHRICDS